MTLTTESEVHRRRMKRIGVASLAALALLAGCAGFTPKPEALVLERAQKPDGALSVT